MWKIKKTTLTLFVLSAAMNTILKNPDIDTLLKNAKFVFAKSMPKLPHHYTLRETWDSNTFDYVVQKIRELGVPERFFKKTYIYYYANGYKYWTMGNPIDQTKLINRAISDKADQF